MTQQSLITRLKAVEEALEYAEHRLASSQPEVARDTRTHISEPLSDLRELIKEAEGQKAVGYRDVYLVDEDHQTKHIVVDTYNAIGEKP